MTDNYFKTLKGEFIQNYLNHYLILKNVDVLAYDWGYRIRAVTKLNDFIIIIDIDNNNNNVEELCYNALSKIKTKIIEHYINPHL